MLFFFKRNKFAETLVKLLQNLQKQKEEENTHTNIQNWKTHRGEKKKQNNQSKISLKGSKQKRYMICYRLLNNKTKQKQHL